MINFYPRSPCGRATKRNPAIYINLQFLSTLSLRRATAISAVLELVPLFLSTLSLRRATRLPTALRTPHQNFYPRSPCGERLDTARMSSRLEEISIHALLAESDSIQILIPAMGRLFLSTLSLRRATRKAFLTFCQSGFLSTLSLRRATFSTFSASITPSFLSTLSLRRATGV